MTESAGEVRTRIQAEADAAAAEWDDDSTTAPVRSRARSSATAQVDSVRIPSEQLQRLRALADARGVGTSVLMREWVLERLDQEVSGAGTASDSRADVTSPGERTRPR